MRKIVDYVVRASYSRETLTDWVTLDIKGGWDPLGPVAVTWDVSKLEPLFAQAVVKYEPPLQTIA